MTELKLYKFLNDTAQEFRWCNDEFLVWIGFDALEEFTEMIGEDYLCEGGMNINLQHDCVCLDIADLATYHGIDLENILKKEEEGV